jgi:hypothetical protein
VHDLGELYRRSGSDLTQIAPAEIRRLIRGWLDEVTDWRSFLATPLRLDPESLVERGIRRRLTALPSKVRLLGDAVSMDYEVEDGTGVVRLRLGEKQAGQRPALRADSLGELRAKLREAFETGLTRRPTQAKGKPPRGRRGRRRRR